MSLSARSAGGYLTNVPVIIEVNMIRDRGTHQTMNQAYIYVLIENDESTKLHKTGLD